MAKKTKKAVKKAAPKKKAVEKEVKKKYFARDTADRFFTVEANGFDLNLLAGVEKEVSKEVAEALKKDFPYIEVVKR